MGRISNRALVWSLKRYTQDNNLWDRVCFACKLVTPVFEYEHHDEQGQPHFNYLCEECAQKKLKEWLQRSQHSDGTQPDRPISFDIATVVYEQKNDGETLQLTRWSTEQRRRRLQIDLE